MRIKNVAIGMGARDPRLRKYDYKQRVWQGQAAAAGSSLLYQQPREPITHYKQKVWQGHSGFLTACGEIPCLSEPKLSIKGGAR